MCDWQWNGSRSESLVEEFAYLHEKGITTDNLRISNRAHVIFRIIFELDEVEEERKGANKIGTTKKGIGPAYMDKAARIGIRIADLFDHEVFEEKLDAKFKRKKSYVRTFL